MLTRDKTVLPSDSLITSIGLPDSLLAAPFFDLSAVFQTSLSHQEDSYDFMNPTQKILAQRVCLNLFTVLGQAQQHESLCAQSLA